MCLLAYLLVCLFVSLPLSACMSVRLFACPFVCLPSDSLSPCLSVSLPVCLGSICLAVGLSFCLSVGRSVCLSFCLSVFFYPSSRRSSFQPLSAIKASVHLSPPLPSQSWRCVRCWQHQISVSHGRARPGPFPQMGRSD